MVMQVGTLTNWDCSDMQHAIAAVLSARSMQCSTVYVMLS